MKTANDRRAFARQPVVANRAALDWGSTTKDGGHDARLLDISRSGASLESQDEPPAGQPIWFRLESPTITSWISATVVRNAGPRQVGVRFGVECPDEVMLAATLGISLVF